MAGARINAHTRRRVGHSLCPLGTCEEGELCPHAVHMALRMEDGREGDVMYQAWKSLETTILPLRPMGAKLLTNTLEDRYPYPTSH